jgi:hypothetical protein
MGLRQMTSLTLRLAAAIELALVCAEGVMPGADSVLPLGGNDLSQIGAVFGISYVLVELTGIVADLIRRVFTRLCGD